MKKILGLALLSVLPGGCHNAVEETYDLPPGFFADAVDFLGKEAASHASLEFFYYDRYGYGCENEWWDYDVYHRGFIHYFEYLYELACQRIKAELSKQAREAFENDEFEWKCYGCPMFGETTPQPDWMCVRAETQYRRFLRNRVAYLESSPARRQIIDKINRLTVPYVGITQLPIRYCEVQRRTPVSTEKDEGVFYTECIATVLPDFCHEVTLGNDEYLIGLLLPTNDVFSEPSTWGRERNLCIWKNREFHAVHQLPLECMVLSVQPAGTEVVVTYVQKGSEESFFKRIDWRTCKQRTMSFDMRISTFGSIRITNWLDYFMDGLGHIHLENCCKGRFQEDAATTHAPPAMIGR